VAKRWFLRRPGRITIYVVASASVGALVDLFVPEQNPWWVVLIVAAVTLVIDLATQRAEQRPEKPVSTLRKRSEDAPNIKRTAHVENVVRHLVSSKRWGIFKRKGPIFITTGIHGAGGFGKTMLAQQVSEHPQVQKHFPTQLTIVIGDETAGPELASKINDVSYAICGKRPEFSDPDLAGDRLGQVLDESPGAILLTIDDVWTATQLRPFLKGGRRCVRLVTTRRPALLPENAAKVLVDMMTPDEAALVIRHGVGGLSDQLVEALVNVAGRWALLLAIINARLRRDAKRYSAEVAGQEVLELLRELGPTALDARNTADRSKAVQATIQVGTDRLAGEGALRFAELGIFAEDLHIPVPAIAKLWQATAGLTLADTCDLVDDLRELSLAEVIDGGGRGEEKLILHDVIRDYLRGVLGDEGVRRAGDALLSLIGSQLTSPGKWWQMDPADHFFWRHLPTHLAEAGRENERDALVTDLRWVGAKLGVLGVEAVAADLYSAQTERASALLRVLTQSAGMLAPTSPEASVAHVFYNRLRDLPEWTEEAAGAAEGSGPGLIPAWPLPDRFDPVLLGVLYGLAKPGGAKAITTSPAGGLIAAAEDSGLVHLWERKNLRPRPAIQTGVRTITGLVIAPDDSWFAIAGADRSIEIWDTRTGQRRSLLQGHVGPVHDLVIEPGGRRLASASDDRTVRVWDTGGTCKPMVLGDVGTIAFSRNGLIAAYAGQTEIRIWDLADDRSWQMLQGLPDVQAMAFTADGLHLATVATATQGLSARIWSVATAACVAELAIPAPAALPVLLHPDAGWIAVTAGSEIRVWNLPAPAGAQAGRVASQRAAELSEAPLPLRGTEDSGAVVSGPGVSAPETSASTASGSVAASGSVGGEARPRVVLRGHTGAVRAIAGVDPRLMLTAAGDGEVRLWDVQAAPNPQPDTERARPGRAVVATADGVHLLVALEDNRILARDNASGSVRAQLVGHSDRVLCLARADDLLVSGSLDQTIRAWDLATGKPIGPIKHHWYRVNAVAVAPDGSWLASGGADGLVRLWTVPEAASQHFFATKADTVRAMIVSPDGGTLVTAGGSGLISFWSTNGWTRQGPQLECSDLVSALALSHNGELLFSAGRAGQIQPWRLPAGAPMSPWLGHSRWIHTLALSPDEKHLVSAGEDREIRVWEVSTGQCVAMTRVTKPVRGCTWLAPGRIAATGEAGTYVFTVKSPSR
jgi:WD40 repeat protein